MKLLKYSLASLALALIAMGFMSPAHAQVYPYFSPGCALTGTGTQQSVNLSTGACIQGSLDISHLNSGTGANNTTFWRGDGVWASPPGTGGGTVNSVAASAVTPLCVSGSPITNTGTFAFTWCTGLTANQFLATPNGSTGAVSMRAIVGADLPAINLAASGAGGVTGNLPVGNLNSGTAATSTTYWSGAGTWTAPVTALANPTGVIGLTAVNGTGTSGIRSDGAPALSQAITPTWTNLHTFSAGLTSTGAITGNGGETITTGSGVAETIHGIASNFASVITSPNTAGVSNGIKVSAGTTSADVAALVTNAAGTTNYVQVVGDGGVVVGAPTGGDKGVGTINTTGVFVNGTAVGGGSTGANPTASIGLTAVAGSLTTYLRSDGAPALSQAIVPTWTGAHTFSPASGVGVTVNGLAASPAITANTVAAADVAFNAIGSAATQLSAFQIKQGAQAAWLAYEPASINDLRFNNGSDVLTLGAAGNVAISAPSSGAALTISGAAAQIGIFNGAGANTYFDYNRSATLVGRIGSADSVVASGASTDFGISSPGGGLNFATGSSSVSHMTIASNGSTVIQTANDGQLQLNALSGGQFSTLEYANAGNIKTEVYWDNSSNLFNINANAGSGGVLITSTTGVVVGGASGGGEGAGSLNAQALYVNGVPVNASPTGSLRTFFGTCAAAGGFSSSFQHNSSICTHNSTGNYTITFGGAGYTTTGPSCTATVVNSVDSRATIDAVTTNSVQILTYATGGSQLDEVVSFHCVGF